MTVETWLDWSSWLIGVRVDWHQAWHHIVIEIGPCAVCISFEVPNDPA